MALKKYPEINYMEHPAFSGLFESYKYDDIKINKMISNIDELIEKASEVPSVGQIKIIFEHEVSATIDSLVTYVKENIDSIVAFELFINSINYVKSEIFKNLLRGPFKLKYKQRKCEISKLESIKQDGMCIVGIDENIKRELYTASRPYYNRLQKKAEEFPHLRSYESVKRFSELSHCINKLVKKTNILNIVSNYMQTDMEILGTGIEYSSDAHTWYKNPYPDIQNYYSDHYYLHVDEGAAFPKTLYYLNPVKKIEQGATKFITGSHKATRSNFISLFQKGMDRASTDRYFKIDDSYYRPMYKNLELRKLLTKFPSRLIGSSHLGDDVIPESDIAKELSKNEISFLSDGLEALVFDGANGLHKGANVTEGERLSLQIIYRPKNEFLIDRLSKKYTQTDKFKLLINQIKGLYL